MANQVAAQPGPNLEPTLAHERVDLIDILRGVAILGILFVNIGNFSFPEMHTDFLDEIFPGAGDRAARWAVRILIEGKLYTMFSFLFGLGVAIQAGRARERGRGYAGFHCRRLIALLAIGLAHDILLWNGRILIGYALLGFLLLPFLYRKPKTLLIWALALIFLPIIVGPILSAALRPAAPPAREAPAIAGEAPAPEVAPEETPPPRERSIEERREERMRQRRGDLDREIRLFRTGSYREMVQFRLEALPLTLRAVLFFAPYMLAVFLFGMWSWKIGLLQRVEEHLRWIKRLFWGGLIVGVSGNFLFLILPELLQSRPTLFVGSLMGLGFFIGNPALCGCYIAAIVLLARTSPGRRLLSPLAAVGRMALSNYLLQSILGSLLFYSFGLGLFGTTGPLANLLLTLPVFAVQILLSNAWLRKFRFGPAEWLWRSMTYGKPQPMRIPQP